MKTQEQWIELKNSLVIEHRSYINGEYCDAQSGQTLAVINPATDEKLTDIARCQSEDVDLAVKYARQAFQSGEWSSSAPSHRKAVLYKFADLIDQHRETLALLETLDTGKPISHSVSTDVPGAANSLRWYAEAIDKVYGEVAPTEKDVHAFISHQAIGVVAAVVPWNFPLWLACWKLGPALAAGNSVILKPSEKSSLTAIYLGQLAEQAGLAKGVFQVVTGFGHEAGDALAKHHDVDCIAFTGSTRIAGQLMIRSGETNLKRVFAEAGGKNANIVFEDCDDLDRAAAETAAGCFYNQGEVCVAATRLLVHESIKDRFVDKVISAAQAFMPKDPLDTSSSMGALIDQEHKAKVLEYILLGQAEGATLRCGGDVQGQGAFVEPTILDNVDNKMKVAQEEIFGPVLCVIPFKDEAQAIEIANDSQYGLGAALWSSNINRVHRVAKQLQAGSVWVNNYNEGDMTVPFGGFKMSGNGRDKSLHAIEKFTETKTTWIRLHP
ncbi:aldehyde dehydrogenase [Vibrio brasiliensis]|jgi:gamma-glutamyl-gamma-aminobutyraldehyde dehydrogenase|uniref:Aldehyde dehydrogenase n=1 Tax=Vibrio brasiliensis LMG 20546 TaxID=945543 RepID=E8LTA8_9VIBR|nr:aldehyde dehydrogenase [Vibrio brasiliensis]EGA66001.1 putative aldehyde dehydrogenase [Vibrio brasiliensis LMG 20546]MCG9647634.1 aldehyde dehydrogenase [Vibrio brasiliensis]MCG9726429.1 aldehyde dehydrogenase [Vibrio brasiliensis]MCG9751834.1 aldehyde dehydrogenase [Vibrio brasiliensis]MCG9781680.1 aldehyde dehydrogenase [Vibrio brasiliensis]